MTDHLPVPFCPAASRFYQSDTLRICLYAAGCWGDFDQVATQFAFVPTGKDISISSLVRSSNFFITNRLQQSTAYHHIRTVVNHLHKMTRSGRAYPLATGSAVRCFCRNALKDRFHFRPCFLRTAGHDRSSIKAPSSPPDTPLPTKRNPFDSASLTRRLVSS